MAYGSPIAPLPLHWQVFYIMTHTPKSTAMKWGGVLGSALALALLGFVFGKLPSTHLLPNSSEPERQELILARRDQLLRVVQTLGGLGLIATAYWAWRTLNLFQDERYSDRFRHAIPMLADDQLTIRLGGILTLSHLVRKSPAHVLMVRALLVAFVREQTTTAAASPQTVAYDIQSALTAISHCPATAEMPPLDLSGCQLPGVQLNGLQLRGAILNGANLQHAQLNATDLQSAQMNGADLKNAALRGARLEQASLQHSDLRWAQLNSAIATRANFQGANLQQADMQNANLTGAQLQHTQLQQAQLQQADLTHAALDNAQLQQAQLQHTDLRGANLRDANLQQSLCNGANLDSVNLDGINLRWASLAGANLQRASFNGADLQGAVLEGALFEPASLMKANLKDTQLAPKFDPPAPVD